MKSLNLPLELIHQIFDYLCFDELSKARLVCKEWNNFICKEFKIKELNHFYNGKITMNGIEFRDSQEKKIWGFTNKCSDRRFAINKLPKNFLIEMPFNFEFLKRLKIRFIKKNAKFINKYFDSISKLVHLETIELVIDGSPKLDCKLTHHSLKFLVLNISRIKEYLSSAFEIDTPMVTKLALSPIFEEYLQYTHPLSVTHLSLYKYSAKVSIFKNLEYLYVKNFFSLKEDNLLRTFTKLNMLRLNEIWKYCPLTYSFSSSLRTDTLNLLKAMKCQFIKQLLQQKLILKRNDLQIISDGIELSNDKDVEDYSEMNFFFDDSYFLGNFNDFIVKNYAKLSRLPYIDWLYYDSKIETLYKSSAEIFFTKIQDIIIIRTDNKIEDEELFLKFIGDCALLDILCIENSSQLGQSFFDRLPEVSSLHTLRIYDDADKKLNYTFLYRISNLRYFFTNQDLDFSGCNLNDLKNLEYLILEINKKSFKIKKLKSNKYICKDWSLNKFSLSSLINHCKKARKKRNRLSFPFLSE